MKNQPSTSNYSRVAFRRKTRTIVKAVLAWLIIAVMFIEVPINLYAATQQIGFAVDENQIHVQDILVEDEVALVTQPGSDADNLITSPTQARRTYLEARLDTLQIYLTELQVEFDVLDIAISAALSAEGQTLSPTIADISMLDAQIADLTQTGNLYNASILALHNRSFEINQQLAVLRGDRENTYYIKELEAEFADILQRQEVYQSNLNAISIQLPTLTAERNAMEAYVPDQIKEVDTTELMTQQEIVSKQIVQLEVEIETINQEASSLRQLELSTIVQPNVPSTAQIWQMQATTSNIVGDNVGDSAIWRISHEIIPPTAEHVDVRVYLHQTSDVGMQTVFLRFGYDPDVLSNPRPIDNIVYTFFDFSLLTADQYASFNSWVNMHIAMGSSPEQALADVKAMGMFSHAWVTESTIFADHAGFDFLFLLSYEAHGGGGGHLWGPNIVQLRWMPAAGYDRFGLPFVYIRFDVEPGVPVGTTTVIDFPIPMDMSSQYGRPIHTYPGSVLIAQDTFQLTVNNFPTATEMGVTISGQTTSSPRVAGTALNLASGTAAPWQFLGWADAESDFATANGMSWEDAVEEGYINPFNATDATMPASNLTVFAVWGADGIIGANLVVGNLPSIDVNGQTLTQAVTVGDRVTLAHGTPVDTTLDFLGWVRGTNLPNIGDDFAVWAEANPTITFAAGHETNEFAVGSMYRYTAIWGRGGVVGANLIITNVPSTMVATGQTRNQYIAYNATGSFALTAGTPPTLDPAWIFHGWVLPGDTVPAYGTPVSDLGAYTLHLTHTIDRTIFADGVARTYTAVWSRNGVVGGANLIIRNVPVDVVPVDQTANQYVLVGGTVALQPGTPPTRLYFAGWIRGDVVPNTGENFEEWQDENPAVIVHYPSHTTAPFADEDVKIYTAIWVCTFGIVGGENVTIHFIAGANGTLVGGSPQTAYLALDARIRDAHIPTPAADTDFAFSHWELENVRVSPTSMNAEEGLTFTAIFVPDWTLRTTILIRYFDLDDYTAPNSNRIPFSVRYVELYRIQGVPTFYVYTVPEVLESPFRYYHVNDPLGFGGDVRFTVNGIAIDWPDMDPATRVVVFNDISADGSDTIDVFFTRAIVDTEINIRIRHVIVDENGSELYTLYATPSRELKDGEVYIPALLTYECMYEHEDYVYGEFVFIGASSIEDPCLTLAARQMIIRYGMVNEMTLVYQVQHFTSHNYYVRHFVELANGDRVLIDTNIISGSLRAAMVGEFVPVLPIAPDLDDDNETDNDNEADNEVGNDDDADNEVDNDDDADNETDNEVGSDDEADNDVDTETDTEIDDGDETDNDANNETDTETNNDNETETIVALSGSGRMLLGSMISSVVGFDVSLPELLPAPFVAAIEDWVDFLLNYDDVVASRDALLELLIEYGIMLQGYCEYSSIFEGGTVLDLIYVMYEQDTYAKVFHYFGETLLHTEEFVPVEVGSLFAPVPRGFSYQGVNLVPTYIAAPRTIVSNGNGNGTDNFFVIIYELQGVTSPLETRIYIEFVAGDLTLMPREFYALATGVSQEVDARSRLENNVFVYGGYYWRLVDHYRRVINLLNDTIDNEFVAVFEFERSGPVAVLHTVTFNLNGGSGNFPQQVVINGHTAVQPTVLPTRESYNFVGWTLNGVLFNFDTPITASITLTAQWSGIFGPPPPRPPQRVVYEAIPQIEPPAELEELFRARFMIGYPNGNFVPYGSITRAEAAALLVRTMTSDFGVISRTGGSMSFSDVSEDGWYFHYISIAYRYGMVQGFPDGTFRPNQPITRQEFAGMMARISRSVMTGGSLPYTDASNVCDWAYNYVYTMLRLGWMHGDAVGTFRPQSNITRSEAAALVSRALNRGEVNAYSIVDTPNVHIFPDAANRNAWYFYYVLDATNSRWLVMDYDVEVWTRVIDYVR